MRRLLVVLACLGAACGGGGGGSTPTGPSTAARANVTITEMTIQPSRNGAGYSYAVRLTIQNTGQASATLTGLTLRLSFGSTQAGTGTAAIADVFSSATLAAGASATSALMTLDDATAPNGQATAISATLTFTDPGGSNTATRSADVAMLATSFALTGTVSESTPTTGTRIPGARVEIIDGPHAGKSAFAAADGTFRIDGLTGDMNVRTSATGYEIDGRGFNMSQDRTATINLRPVFAIITEDLNGTLSGGDTFTCSDGIFTKPCRSFTINIHHSGTLTADLEFSPGTNDLDLSLWRSGSLIAASRGVSSRESVSSAVSAGSSYQLRVTYYDGPTIANFRLRVTRPN